MSQKIRPIQEDGGSEGSVNLSNVEANPADPERKRTF